MYKRRIVPEDFRVPKNFKTEEFFLKPLTITNLIEDYDAVMSSSNHLKGLMDESNWPLGLTIEENLIDLGWHQREFTLGHSFTYAVLSRDKKSYLGCCYIYPEEEIINGIQVFYWIRQSKLREGLEVRLGEVLKKWLSTCWPFEVVRFPGRT